MSRLGPEARAILDSARDIGEPNDASLARVRSSLMARVGVATATAGTIGALASTAKAGVGASLAPAAGGVGVGLGVGATSLTVKLVATMAVVVGLGAGGVAYHAHQSAVRERSETAAATQATKHGSTIWGSGHGAAPPTFAPRSLPPTEKTEKTPLDVASSDLTVAPSLPPPSVRVAPLARAVSHASSSAVANRAVTLSPPAKPSTDEGATPIVASPEANASQAYAEDVAKLREAQAALVAGDAIQALRAAGKVDALGPFAEEREGIQILARCELGDGAARSDAARFVSRRPGSPLALRIQAACSQ